VADTNEREKRGVGVLTRLLVIVLAFIGLWVVIGHAYDWAHPWWRYATIASIFFTLGTMYGRFRRWERDEKKKAAR